MKSKKITYLLIGLVAIVWGLIIYRIFDSLNQNNDQPEPKYTGVVKKKLENYDSIYPHTQLALNYRDPFGIARNDTAIVKISKNHDLKISDVIPAKPAAINWNFVNYSGYINNPQSKKIISIMKINGREAMMKDGEVIDRVKLLKNMEDSIKISYLGKIRFIKIKPSAQ